MPNYRLVANGYVDSALSDNDLNSLFKNLRYLRKDSYDDFEMIISGHVAVETLRIAKAIIGGSFKEWLEVNFNNGRGPLADIIREILYYLAGKQSFTTVVTATRIDENIMEASARQRRGSYSSSSASGHSDLFIKHGHTVQDYDLYRLMAGVGPGVVGRILLLIGGEAYYA